MPEADGDGGIAAISMKLSSMLMLVLPIRVRMLSTTNAPGVADLAADQYVRGTSPTRFLAHLPDQEQEQAFFVVEPISRGACLAGETCD
ncbi:hypothetical protein [Streptomyces europaeiscabiei]|uniref:hypothetical protein n=1 Tax=Streptomyces europaeiscabiei TaxID=146819 RepID=UPI002E2E58C9|nr:hypothetical protein [Streptomyces europaeiscabiei]